VLSGSRADGTDFYLAAQSQITPGKSC